MCPCVLFLLILFHACQKLQLLTCCSSSSFKSTKRVSECCRLKSDFLKCVRVRFTCAEQQLCRRQHSKVTSGRADYRTAGAVFDQRWHYNLKMHFGWVKIFLSPSVAVFLVRCEADHDFFHSAMKSLTNSVCSFEFCCNTYLLKIV